MGLDLNKLEKAKRKGSNIIAQCPACAETGGDRKGEHLFITDKGQFGCVLYPGQNGRQHRQRIFELAGAKKIIDKAFEIKRPLSFSHTERIVIQKDILGHLGHIQSTHARKNLKNPICKNKANAEESFTAPVPNVPRTESKKQNDTILETG